MSIRIVDALKKKIVAAKIRKISRIGYVAGQTGADALADAFKVVCEETKPAIAELGKVIYDNADAIAELYLTAEPIMNDLQAAIKPLTKKLVKRMEPSLKRSNKIMEVIDKKLDKRIKTRWIPRFKAIEKELKRMSK